MSPSIQTEARLILVSAAAGAGLMAVYDGLRIFRLLVRHSWLWVGLEDFLYWIFGQQGFKAGDSMRGRGKTRRKKRDRWGNRMAIMGITLVVASLAVVVNLKSTSMRKKELEYQIREETLEKQKAEEENRARELEEYRVYVQTKQYIEEIAKQKLGLVNPDEILLKPAPKE